MLRRFALGAIFAIAKACLDIVCVISAPGQSGGIEKGLNNVSIIVSLLALGGATDACFGAGA